jgi:hypothetical protein
MRLRHAALLAVLVPSLIGLATLPFSSAAAQEGAGAEEAGQPEEPQGPQIEPSIRFVDRRSMVEIQLPKNWKADKFTEDNGRIAHWVWPTEDGGAVAGVTLIQNEGFMRARLLRHAALESRKLVEGTLREGDGWAEACGIEQDRIAVYDRYVEKDGIVWVAQFVCHKSNLETFKKVFLPAMESFTVTGTYEPKGLPDDWTEKKVKDYVLWTDADEKNVDEAVNIVKPLLEMRKLARKVFDGDPYYDEPTRVKVIQSGTIFDKTAVASTGQKPDNAVYDARGRALLVKWMSRNSQGFQSDMNQFAAAQLVSEHYGGNLPFWLSGGLRMYLFYGFEEGGKPQKPDKGRLSRARSTIGLAKLRLDQWFTTKLQDVPDSSRGFTEVWAWHWFFRHAKQGKKYRKMYDASLDALLETGDPAKAEAAFEGADFEKMFEDFKKWGESIK